jgi:hypothetical protein
MFVLISRWFIRSSVVGWMGYASQGSFVYCAADLLLAATDVYLRLPKLVSATANGLAQMSHIAN